MAQLILSEIEGQNIYKVYVQPGQDYLLYGKVSTTDATAKYILREVSVNGQVLTNEETMISNTDGLHEFSKLFTTSGATVLLIIVLTNAEVLELSLDGPPGVVLITTPVENTLRHISQFNILISYLDYAFEVKISQKLNGDNRLTFNLPYDDEKGQEIVNENFIEYDGQKYIIKSVKDDNVQKVKTIEAEHVGLGLIDYWLQDTLVLPSVSAVVALEAILADTPYTVGIINVTGVNDLEIEVCNKLKAVKTVQELWGGELYFDDYEVNLVQQMGQDNGVQFRKGKNLDKIIRTLDTNNLTTKLFGYGKDNLVITGLDTTGWTEEQKAGLTIIDDLVTEPYMISQYISNYAREYQGEFRNSDIDGQQELLDAMREAMSKQEIPRITYEVDVIDLSSMAQYVGEGFGLGDTVKVIDEDLNVDVQARIVEYDKYPFEPWRDKTVLANFTQNLHDYLANLSTMRDTFDRMVTKGKVSTAWLEGIINVLRNELVADTANVSITDTDGILIVSGDGTKALNLRGGIFAIANSKLGDGSWNWRTFGTGDGFTADCIVTGKLLTSLVEIVGEAVDGENKFYWDSTGLYAVDPDNANRYMKFSKEGLRGYVDGILRLHLGPYAADKFGLLLRAPDGITTILDEDGILQTWQEGRADNVDGSHSLALNVYLPPETKAVYKALLRLKLQAFRAYETGAASGGGSTPTTSSGGSTTRTSDSPIYHMSGSLSADWMYYAGSHNHGISNGTKLAVDGGGYVEFVQSGSHAHDRDVGHDHSIYIPSHTHGVTVPSHLHDINYGIYTSTSATGVTVIINGVDRTAALGGPFNSDQASLNIAAYMLTDQWNTIQLGSSQLGRIDATIFIQAKMGV